MHRDATFLISNTLALPCSARGLFWISSPDDVRGAIEWAGKSALSLMPLGEGSNVVLPPHLEAAVLKVSDTSMTLLSEEQDKVTLRVGAGKGWHELVTETLACGYYGLENLALIPGLVGAAPVQNIGAYGAEFDEFVLAVHGVNLVTGTTQTLSADECGFSYRSSVFKEVLRDRFLITAVDIRLARTTSLNIEYPALKARLEAPLATQPVTAQAVFDAVVALRRERLPDPATTPNAGSFFKNPILATKQLLDLQRAAPGVPVYSVSDQHSKVSAAWLIEHAGLRGCSRGAAAISDRHALVVVTRTGAEQTDVLKLAAHVQEVVQERFAVMLEPEPRIYA